MALKAGRGGPGELRRWNASGGTWGAVAGSPAAAFPWLVRAVRRRGASGVERVSARFALSALNGRFRTGTDLGNPTV